jgi:transcriptional regulator with XRE-family HTH domain
MESAVKQRLVQFIKIMNLTQKAFEDRCGMSNGYVANIRKGIGDDKLLNIVQQFPQLNREWLLYGEGEMLKPQPQVMQNNYNGNNNYVVGNGNSVQCSECGADVQTLEAEEVERAPIVPATLARAPQTDVLEAVQERIGKLELAPVGVIDTPVSLWYRVQDESVCPKYEIGDLIGLWAYPKGEEDPIPGKLYGINTLTNGLIIRKLLPMEDGGYIARAVNREEYPDYKIKASNIVQIYKIMLMVRF